MSGERILYQFPLSLYCEKTRWNLASKGLEHRCVDLLPGLHAFTARRWGGIRTLPVLRDGRRGVGDSAAIALYLEQHYPAHPLLPAEPALCAEALEWEALFDELGVHTRRCCWSLSVEADAIDELFFGFQGYGGWRRQLGKAGRPLLRKMVRHTFDVFDEPVAYSWGEIARVWALLERRLEGDPERYLVGGRFTLADLTGAAMLAPLIGPEQCPWPDHAMVVPGMAGRQQLRETAAGQWVLNQYAWQRGEASQRLAPD